MGKIASISLCMIVKDEEEYLPVCLQKTRPILDEIVIVDTGSRDRTVEVARNFGAKIFSHDWADDFSEARNISLTHATKDWILILDADELISERDLAELPTLCREEIFKAFSFTTRNYTNDSSGAIWIPDDGSYAESAKFAGWFPSEKVRLFRRDERVRFEGVVHELVEASIRELGWAIGYTHIPIHHYGKIKKDNILKTKKRLYVQWGREKVRREHSNPKAYYEHGIQCSDLGLHEEAAGAFSRVLELDNNFPLVEGLLGASLVNLGRFNEAIEVLKKGIQKEPENPGIYNNIGSAYYQRGEYREACRYLEEATQLNPQYAAAFKNLGMAYYGKGEKAKAMDAFQNALELNPRMDDVREVLQRLNSMVQGSEFAVQTSEGEREQGRMNSEGIAAKNGPLRIVILEVEDGMLGDCCARGFKDIGHITKRIRFKVEDETHSQLAFDVFRMVKEVMDFTPDFVLSINFRGLDIDGVLLRAFTALKIPVIVWYVDSPFSLIRSFDSLSGIISLVFDEALAGKLMNMSVDRVYHLPLGADITAFREIQIDPEDEKRYRCDLSFVGKLDLRKVEILRNELMNRWPEIPSSVVEAINEAVKRSARDPTRSIPFVIQETCEEYDVKKVEYPSDEIRRLIEIIVEFEAGSRSRADVIKQLSGFAIKICGERDWLTVIPPSQLIDPVPYFEGLAKVYNASKINLNISRVQLKTTVNQRVFDVPACKAFLITDYKEELGKYFEIGKEIVCYRDMDELKKLVAYYLKHPEERERIAKAGHQRVLRDHTYAHRMQRVVDIYYENLPTLCYEAEKKDESYGRAYDIVGRIYLQMHEYEKAVSYLRRSLLILSGVDYQFNDLGALHLLHYHSGRCYEEIGDYEAAVKHYRKAIEIKSGFIDPVARLGTLYLKHNDYSGAREMLEMAVDIDSEDPSLFSNLALVYSKLGDIAKAEETYLRCLELAPDFLEALTNLGHLYLRNERLDEAEEMFEKVFTVHGSRFRVQSSEFNGEPIDIHLALGLIYARRFEVEECVKKCDDILQLLKMPRNFILDDLKDLAALYHEIGLKLKGEKRSREASLALETASAIQGLQSIP